MAITCAVPVLPPLVYCAPAKARARGAFLVDAGHGALHELDVLGARQRCTHAQPRIDYAPLAGARVVDVGDEMRPVQRAAVGERGDRPGRADRRVGVVALADADRDRLAGIPLLLLGAT